MRDHILPVLEAIVGGPDSSRTKPQPPLDVRHTYLSDEIGAALFLSYLQRDLPNLCTPDAADRHLQNAIDVVAQLQLPRHLFGGFTGVAWTIADLQKMSGNEANGSDAVDGDDAATDELRDIDDTLALLEQVDARLDQLAEHNEQVTTWHTAAERLPEWQRDLYPGGHFNLGQGHGVPAVVAVLAGAVADGVAIDRARPLLDGAASWLLAQRLPPGGETNFLKMTAPDVEPAMHAQRIWISDCLHHFETGGFEGWRKPNEEQPPSGLLTGATGIGLALLAAVSNQAPDRNRTLLTNMPPRSSK